MATRQPMPCTHCTSFDWLCHGSPHLKNPPGMRTTMGAANRLAVRQRIVPQSLSCSAAGSAYLRNWISGTGKSPAAAIPTARPMIPSSDKLVSNTRAAPNFSCKPMVAACTPPLRPTSSPNTTMRGFTASSCSRVRRTAVTRLIRGPWTCARSEPAGGRAPSAHRPPCVWMSIAPSAVDSVNTYRLTRAGSGTLKRSTRSRASATAARARRHLRIPLLGREHLAERSARGACAKGRAPARPQ